MKNSIFCLAFIVLCAAQAPNPVTTDRVTSGVRHSTYRLPGPFSLHVIEVDLQDTSIVVETYKPECLTRTSAQAAANDRIRHRVLAAVNADFFSFTTGWPVGNQVVNGKPVLGVRDAHSALGISRAGKVTIEKYAFHGAIVARDGSTAAIRTINTERDSGSIVLYTSFRGPTTRTDSTGTERTLSLISPSWTANDTLRFIVTAVTSPGNSEIPVNGAVLSGGKSARPFLSNALNLSDTVKVFAGYAPIVSPLMQLIAGRGRIVTAGRDAGSIHDTSEAGMKFLTARHPRTFAGINADSSKLFLCTVDGRQASSLGMSFSEMAAFLQSIHVTEAFNLDGGGSTTMVVHCNIVNSPSDSLGERPVANTLQIIDITP